MNKMLRKNKLVGVALIAGISGLIANPALSEEKFHFSYTFNDGNPGVTVPTIFQGTVEGTLDMTGTLLDPLITSFNVLQDEDGNGDFDIVNSFMDSEFVNTIFTETGVGVLINTDNMGLGDFNLTLQQDLTNPLADYLIGPFADGGGTAVAETEFDLDRWTFESASDKQSVPEGNMSVVSWLALAGIAGLSVKFGKRKSL